MQLIGIMLLYLVGLSGFDDILGKKRAELSICTNIVVQINRLA